MEKYRRTLRDIERFRSPEQVLEIIENGKPWPYKRTPKYYRARDRALTSFIYLMGCRVGESLKVNRDQIDLKEDSDFILVKDFQISKRKEKTLKAEGIPRIDFGLPRSGSFSPFTNMVLKWIELSPYVTKKLFPGIGRITAWRRIEHLTGKWPHWFRAQRLSYLMNLIKSETIVAKMLGIKNPGTITHYYKGEWGMWRSTLQR